jgi:hypothetical protein
MTKLVRVARTKGSPLWVNDHMRHDAKYMPTAEVTDNNPVRQAEFWLIEDRDVDVFIKYMAEANPGVDVEVYGMEKVGHCPAAEFVIKAVTEDGILPA